MRLARGRQGFLFKVPHALKISRSGQGVHVWIFFSSKVLARDAKRLGVAIITHACDVLSQGKSFGIPKALVWKSYQEVCNRGAGGVMDRPSNSLMRTEAGISTKFGVDSARDPTSLRRNSHIARRYNPTLTGWINYYGKFWYRNFSHHLCSIFQ